jgi:hypothetical protein
MLGVDGFPVSNARPAAPVQVDQFYGHVSQAREHRGNGSAGRSFGMRPPNSDAENDGPETAEGKAPGEL